MTDAQLQTAIGGYLALAFAGHVESTQIWQAGTGGPRQEPYATFQVLSDVLEDYERVGSDPEEFRARRLAAVQVDVFGAGSKDALKQLERWQQKTSVLDYEDDNGVSIREMTNIRDLQALDEVRFRPRHQVDITVAYIDAETMAETGETIDDLSIGSTIGDYDEETLTVDISP